MILTDIKYRRYKFNFNLHFNSSKQSFKQKEVIILSAKDPSGKKLYGEVGPLEGFSHENINECNDLINSFLDNVKILDTNNFISIQENFKAYPALLFGFEQLILNSKLNNENITFPTNRININGVVGQNDTQSVMKKIGDLVKNNFKTIKLKVGRNSFDEDYLLVESIYSIFGSDIKLRLDNNGNWNFNDAEQYLNQLSKFNIEYIEQPVSELDELIELSKVSEIPVAIDESLDSLKIAEKIIRNSKIDFLVLKPSIRIGIFDSQRIIELAEQFGNKVIITSAFETAIGRKSLLYLSAHIKHEYAHGLNTELIGEDVISSTINYNSPVIYLSKENIIPEFNLEF